MKFVLMENCGLWVVQSKYPVPNFEVFSAKQMYSSGSSLVLVNSTKSRGDDQFGQFTVQSFTWLAEQLLFQTNFYTYDEGDVIRFSQVFPEGANGPSTFSFFSAFPSFVVPSTSTQLGTLSLAGWPPTTTAGVWGSTIPWTNGVQGNVTENGLVSWFDAFMRHALVLSPSKNVMSGQYYLLACC